MPLIIALLTGRRVRIVLFHLAAIVAANTMAFWLRFDGVPPPPFFRAWLDTLVWLAAIRAGLFVPFGIYEGLWRYTSVSDLRSILLAVISSSTLFWIGVTWLGTPYPRSVLLVDALLLVCLLSGARLSTRLYRESRPRQGQTRVLIYGAGVSGAQIVNRMNDEPQHGYKPVGFVDDDRTKVGGRIHGVPVLGTQLEIARIVARCRPDEVLIAIPGGSAEAIRSLMRVLEPLDIPIKTLPSLRDIVGGRIDVQQIRGLAIEDLLARAPIGLDRAPLHGLIEGRRVLVTGAGGSIGSELCRQIARLKPGQLVMLDRYENTLHAIRLELDERYPGGGMVPVIGDVTDAGRVEAVLSMHRPEIIFHAAAHKHVPLMEENPCEAVKNNVRGTRLLVQAAEAHGVDRFIMVSTDKAVNPTSVMGASKRVAELVVQAQAAGSGTTYSIVRFGNVLGSNGSVVPRFLDQIRKGGPVTVTHPDMRRFFMLIPEAVQLVLHAASQGGNGVTYVLDMGEQLKVVDLARDLIRLSGLANGREIAIEFTGLRPGEKLYEELIGADEVGSPSAIEKIQCVRSRRRPDARLFDQIDVLERAAIDGHGEIVMAALEDVISTFGRSGDASDRGTVQRESWDHAAAEAFPPPKGQECPRCHEEEAYRSHARSLHERLKRDFSAVRLFRCESCGWRGWMRPMEDGRLVSTGQRTVPDLAAVDATIGTVPPPSRSGFSPRNLH